MGTLDHEVSGHGLGTGSRCSICKACDDYLVTFGMVVSLQHVVNRISWCARSAVYQRVRAGRRRWLPRFRHPAQVIVAAFAVAVAVGTGLLLLPIAREGPDSAPLLTALFTATSAVCVTGLIVVDTPMYWSAFGQVVILAMIQVGGFGIMTLASLVGLLISRRLGSRSRLVAAAETKHIGLGDVGRVIVGVITASLLFEAITAVLLTARFALGYDMGLVRAIELGGFHAVSALNNAGFALFSDNMIGFAGTRGSVCRSRLRSSSGGSVSRYCSSCGSGCYGRVNGACRRSFRRHGSGYMINRQ